ncbi:unnamed protein product [Adineta steineri]|uniref:Uncharacterized protein n=1 Tax=Adineta steineri TaxID=433720 RepID=A0A815Q471_9BILA|nr:unnamed protein product [Adineta steineri]CAF1457316.1 unnamed protein product [Adineta steineri]CAF4024421.1 unnamed protein product [Adineta steineri]
MASMVPTHDASNVANENPVNLWIRLKYEERFDKTMKYYTSKMVIVQIITACGFSISELYYGISYSNQCPIEPAINTFLVVHGTTKFVWIFLTILAIVDARLIYKKMNRKSLARRLMLINLAFQSLFAVWFFSWFIAGNIWVFRNRSHYQSNDPTNTSTYCYEELYDAASLLIIITYVGFGITLIATVFRRFISKKLKYIINNKFKRQIKN